MEGFQTGRAKNVFHAAPSVARLRVQSCSFLSSGRRPRVIWGISSRRQSQCSAFSGDTRTCDSTVTVIIQSAERRSRRIILPGDMQPYTDAPIYARTTGYLKSWHVDIGARVKSGQLLAEIDTPEVDQQLQQARADLDTAERTCTWRRSQPRATKT